MEKNRQTCLEKYGVDNWFKTKENHSLELEKRRIETMKLNNSFGNRISKQEKEIYDKLIIIFPNIKTQYKSKLYPFNCDFYIPSLDLYIEFNGSDLHGFHPFDKTNKDDILRLNDLIERSKKLKEQDKRVKNRYDYSIYTWTDLDIRKRNTVKENNLNFIEFWNINEVKEWVTK